MAITSTTLEIPSSNKTLIFDSPSRTLHIEPSRPVPTPDQSKNEHLIRVQTTALCKGELEWPVMFPDAIFSENPEKLITPGYDLAGTVITAPMGSPFHPGDDIYARTLPSRPGNYRGHSIARTAEMALKPQALTWAQAASVPLSALSAWQALFEHAGMQGLRDPSPTTKKILVIAAAGGVGVWLVQFAKLAGLEVVAQIGGAENDRFIRELGASETVNYRQTSLKEWAATNGPVDVVFDCLGGKTLEDAWYCIKDDGSLISIVEPPEGRRPAELIASKAKSEFFIMRPDGHQLAEISKLLDEGQCRAVVDSVWGFEDYEKAFGRLNDGHARGKVVIKVSD